MRDLIRHATRDGALIQVGVRYYVHAHLHDPRELLTLVRAARVAPSWLDGRPTQIWLLHDARGCGYLCEAWQLSRSPQPALYAELLREAGARHPIGAMLRIRGTITAADWNELSGQLVPRLRCRSELQGSLDFKVELMGDAAVTVERELRQAVADVHLTDSIEIVLE